MAKSLQEMMAEADQHAFAIGPPIKLSEAESELLGNAYFLDPAQPLCHFLKVEYFRALLESRALRLRPLSGFVDDPREGRLSVANESEASNVGRRLAQAWGSSPETDGWKRFINGTQRSLIYVHCWFGQEAENQPMWNQYGDGGRGICVKTSARRLQESFQAKPPIFPQVHKVSYLSENVPIPTIISSLAAFRKRPEFVHEKEFRVVTELGFEQCPTDANGALMPPDHQLIPLDLDRLIEAVVLGPNAEEAAFRELELLVKAAGLNRVVRKSRLATWR